MCLMLATPSSPKPLSSSRPAVLPVSSTKSDLSTSTEIDTSGSDITTAHTTAGGIQSASYVSAVRTKSRRDIHSIHTNVGIPDNEKLTLQLKLTDARFKASDALTNYVSRHHFWVTFAYCIHSINMIVFINPWNCVCYIYACMYVYMYYIYIYICQITPAANSAKSCNKNSTNYKVVHVLQFVMP